MPTRNNPAFVEALLLENGKNGKQNHRQEEEDLDDLPIPQAPYQPVCQPARKRSLWAYLFGDRTDRLQDNHHYERLKISCETGTALYRIDAETRKEQAKIISRARTENTRHQVAMQLARQKNKNAGQAVIDEYRDQQDLLEQIEELPLPEEIKHRAARQLGRIYHSKNSANT